ncbi:hypothetical protein TRVL_03574 [Trypanosoma vivax]|uniref:Uncharacterized protein n=1 Tax=Trypanosoma vivax (strain Y486) TaxID=1055687 RepID=G0TTK5_TRYVY|nr:hypothetical protein TRVL_03574 [Trypanosoma vivax]CCC47286.1 hypothetical protein TVY486_0304570 [Trypanosoma vivax Y486]
MFDCIPSNGSARMCMLVRTGHLAGSVWGKAVREEPVVRGDVKGCIRGISSKLTRCASVHVRAYRSAPSLMQRLVTVHALLLIMGPNIPSFCFQFSLLSLLFYCLICFQHSRYGIHTYNGLRSAKSGR